MKNLAILDDAARAPHMFAWNGPIAPDRLDAWLRRHDLRSKCPPDLVRLWAETGGGDFFDSETILGPFANAESGDDVSGANEFLRSRGLPANLLVFCRGAFTGAVDVDGREYVDLEERGLRVRGRYASLDAWYFATERREFAVRYGIK
jgi:hypothetical protein